MKLLNINCGQFAGILKQRYPAEGTFSDGINIIFGPNESGKSTMVSLLSRTLFQTVNIDKRTHRDFIQQCFPAQKRSGHTGDFIDGTVVFQGKNGTYRLSKEWGTLASCILETPDGSRIADPSKISDILEEELFYSEGLFGAVIFPSQKESDRSIQILLNTAQKGKDDAVEIARQEILSVLQQAFVESGGVSIEALGSKIEEKISALEGKHWDAELNIPKRNPKGVRWSKDRGAVLTAFYESEDAENRRCQIETLERSIDQGRRELDQLARNAQQSQAKKAHFEKFRGQLTAWKANAESRDHIDKELRRLSEILKNWPQFQADMERAEQLAAELDHSVVLEQFKKINAIRDSINKAQHNIEAHGAVSKEDRSRAETLIKETDRLERQLGGMNLSARISLHDGYQMQAVSVRTGQLVPVENGVLSLTEAVNLKIPGVMEMELGPADVDLEKVERELGEQRQAFESLLSKYEVSSLEQLEKNYELCERERKTKENLESELKFALSGKTWDELSKAAKNISPDTRTRDEIQSDIKTLCGNTSASSFVSGKKALIDSYQRDFGSVEQLKEKIRQYTEKREGLDKAINGVDQIPIEYRDIQDPEAFANALQNDAELRQKEERSKALELARQEERLESLDLDENDVIKECGEKARVYEELKAELASWKHIQSVFSELKAEVLDHPAGDLAERFVHYLDCISCGGVSADLTGETALDLTLYSRDHRLTFEMLSEGTKGAVALAFRLAVLDHLYPDGNGFAVFDDPFTDMDASRKAEACKLLKEFSKRHQVIFLTCSEEYASLLGGEVFAI